MAKFKGQLSFKVTFDGLNIPNDFDKWIDETKKQLNYFQKTYKRKNFEIKSINKTISIDETEKNKYSEKRKKGGNNKKKRDN